MYPLAQHFHQLLANLQLVKEFGFVEFDLSNLGVEVEVKVAFFLLQKVPVKLVFNFILFLLKKITIFYITLVHKLELF